MANQTKSIYTQDGLSGLAKANQSSQRGMSGISTANQSGTQKPSSNAPSVNSNQTPKTNG